MAAPNASAQTSSTIDHFFAPPDDPSRTKTHLLVACTGSIATIKLPNILTYLSRFSSTLSVHVILTPAAINFLPPSLRNPSPQVSIPSVYPIVSRCWTDADEWVQWRAIGDPVLHIELRKWADLLLIAPLSADFLAKIVGGHVDGLLGGVVRAWDVNKRIVVAPAMNTHMWMHPLTEEHMSVLRERWKDWVTVLEPVEKRLACGDVGTGAMREWSEVVDYVASYLRLQEDVEQKNVDV